MSFLDAGYEVVEFAYPFVAAAFMAAYLGWEHFAAAQRGGMLRLRVYGWKAAIVFWWGVALLLVVGLGVHMCGLSLRAQLVCRWPIGVVLVVAAVAWLRRAARLGHGCRPLEEEGEDGPPSFPGRPPETMEMGTGDGSRGEGG